MKKVIFPWKRINGFAQRFGVLTAIAVLSLLAAAPAFAQEEPESPLTPVFHWINFAIVIVGIAYALKKAAPLFHKRAESIAEAIAEGARARAEGEHRRKEAEAKLAGLPIEVERMRAEAKNDSAGEVERIRALARDDAERIERSGQAEIAAAERAARIELKRVAADLVIAHATRLVNEQMKPEADSIIFQGFLQELDRSVS
jgi:F-type H+-transporting ATPase subunit b